jgi:hypothetical protein
MRITPKPTSVETSTAVGPSFDCWPKLWSKVSAGLRLEWQYFSSAGIDEFPIRKTAKMPIRREMILNLGIPNWSDGDRIDFLAFVIDVEARSVGESAGISICTSDSRIIRFSRDRHNEFATGARPQRDKRDSDGSSLPSDERTFPGPSPGKSCRLNRSMQPHRIALDKSGYR